MAHEFGRRVSTQFLVFPISTRVDITVYFLSVKMKQSDWLRSLSERVGFLHPACSETQLPAVKCNCPLWLSRQKLRSAGNNF
jgi:hypothetical protein